MNSKAFGPDDPWQLLTDTVMGGISQGTLTREDVGGRLAVRMRGDVSLENNGGFIQMALNLRPDGRRFDGSHWLGIEIEAFGNDEDYGIHLRTDDLTRPWQSYRQGFRASRRWEPLRFAFADFKPHRTDAALDIRHLRRVGLVGSGRAFHADLAIAGLRFFGTAV